MKLYQVRKGQFVYFNNELHKVYGVKPMYKESIHLIRLRDLTQHLTKAALVERSKPMERDSFIFNHKAYTLRKDRQAKEGDYVLIYNPLPDSLDTYSLNEIEVVESFDKKGGITSNSHGIKHNEYLLMVPGRGPDSHPTDYKDSQTVEEENIDDMGLQNVNHLTSGQLPSLGDIYKKKDGSESIESLVVAVKGQTYYLGGGLVVSQEELMDTGKWEFLYHIQNQ